MPSDLLGSRAQGVHHLNSCVPVCYLALPQWSPLVNGPTVGTTRLREGRSHKLPASIWHTDGSQGRFLGSWLTQQMWLEAFLMNRNNLAFNEEPDENQLSSKPRFPSQGACKLQGDSTHGGL